VPDRKPPEKPANGDDYIRRLRKDVARRQLERAARRKKKKPEEKTEEDKTPSPKPKDG